MTSTMTSTESEPVFNNFYTPDNQNDVLERNSQVSKMRIFYENAECVLAWLGVLKKGHIAFDVMRSLRAKYDDKLSTYIGNKPTSHRVMPLDRISIQHIIGEGLLKEMLSDDENNPELEAKYEALCNLFRSELWTRLWIWQEIILAKSIYLEWDTHSVEFDGLVIICQILCYIEMATRESIQSTPRIATFLFGSRVFSSNIFAIVELAWRRENWRRQKVLDFKDLLYATQAASSTDPRDKVLALCGLIDPAYNIVPNYTESIVSTYCKTAIAIMELEQSLDILAYCKHPRVSNVSMILPTWCPDWSLKGGEMSRRISMLRNTNSTKSCIFHASAAISGSFTVTAGSLFAQGFPIGTVQSIGSLAEREGESNEEKFDSLLNSLAQLVSEHTTVTEELRLKLERTATIDDAGYPNVNVPRDLIYASNYNNLKRDAVRGRRRFFVTENGLMGMAPPHVQVEDSVCVLLGARVPFLLRKVDSFYTLVGEAYVSDGYMYGAAIRNMEAGKMQVQDFEIR